MPVTIGLMQTPLASAGDHVCGGFCRSGQRTLGLHGMAFSCVTAACGAWRIWAFYLAAVIPIQRG